MIATGFQFFAANASTAAGLPTAAVDGQGVSGGRLRAEAVQHGAENVVVIEAVDQPVVQRGLIRHGAVHHALVEVGCATIAGLHTTDGTLWSEEYQTALLETYHRVFDRV